MIIRRLSSEAWHSSKMHADNFINDCAYGSIGLIILYMSCKYYFRCFYIYVGFVTEGHMVDKLYIS